MRSSKYITKIFYGKNDIILHIKWYLAYKSTEKLCSSFLRISHGHKQKVNKHMKYQKLRCRVFTLHNQGGIIKVDS
jgi:hypothetical protein